MGYAFYLSSAKSLDKKYKGEQVDNFQQEMHQSLINEVCLGVYKIDNPEEIHNLSNKFGYLLDQRFLEYFPLLDPDTKTDFMALSSSFAKYLFKEIITEREKEHFISNLNITIALHLGRMEEKLRVLRH